MEEKEPVPVPFDVFVDKVIIGLVVVDQTTPLAVMEAPPSAVMVPPEVAVVEAIPVTCVVEIVGKLHVVIVVIESFKQRTDAPDDLR